MKRRRVLQLGAALGGGLLARKRRVGARAGKAARPLRTTIAVREGCAVDAGVEDPEAGSSFTPLAESHGILTPSSLHYERHHAGIPNIDPARHRLVIQGMVERPLLLTVDEIKRLPSMSRILLMECGGNSGSEWAATTGPNVQRSHGLASCSEWTGVPLRLLLEEVGVRPGAAWIIAEGRGRRQDAAQHPARESDGRHDARLRPER